MSHLFNLIYAAAMVVLSPWIVWRIVVQKKNRFGWGEKMLGLIPRRNSDAPCIWLHAVSVGEVNLLQPIVERLRQQSPEIEIAISSTTETGLALAEKVFPNEITFFCPADFSWAVKRALRRLKPAGLVLAELELWPNLICITAQQKIPVSVINGRLSVKSSRGYQKFGFLLRPIFQTLTWVGAQSQVYADRFIDNGCHADRVSVTGSVKFDGVETDRNNPKTQSLAATAATANIHQHDFKFIAGSTQLEEDLLVVQAYRDQFQKHSDLRLILVPRHPDRTGLLCDKLVTMGVPFIRRSTLPAGPIKHATVAGQTITQHAVAPVLIVDVIGELSHWWGLADAGFVGGSMGGRGGQSMIEPAGFGVPICFGPNTENFEDTVSQLLENEAAEVVSDLKQLSAFMNWCHEMPHLAQTLGQRSQEVVGRNLGAADWTTAGIMNSIQLPNSLRLPGSSSAVSPGSSSRSPSVPAPGSPHLPASRQANPAASNRVA